MTKAQFSASLDGMDPAAISRVLDQLDQYRSAAVDRLMELDVIALDPVRPTRLLPQASRRKRSP
jgi:hypothetical protein